MPCHSPTLSLTAREGRQPDRTVVAWRRGHVSGEIHYRFARKRGLLSPASQKSHRYSPISSTILPRVYRLATRANVIQRQHRVDLRAQLAGVDGGLLSGTHREHRRTGAGCASGHRHRYRGARSDGDGGVHRAPCGARLRYHFTQAEWVHLSGRGHKLHVTPLGSDRWVRHLLFRDYLPAHPEVASEYERLKREMAQSHGANGERYVAGKTALSTPLWGALGARVPSKTCVTESASALTVS
jgi:hypothetical protein